MYSNTKSVILNCNNISNLLKKILYFFSLKKGSIEEQKTVFKNITNLTNPKLLNGSVYL